MIYGASGWACQDLKGARRPDHITDLLSGDTTDIGAIHDQMPFGSVVIHVVGILRFDAAGNLTFEAGQHQGFSGVPEAIARLCAALA